MYSTLTNAEGKTLLQRRNRSSEAERHLTISRGARPLYSVEMETDGTVRVGVFGLDGTWQELHASPVVTEAAR